MKNLFLNKNIKGLMFGMLVALFAVSFSAFKNAPSKFDPQWVYVQTDTDEYTKIPFGDYNDMDCQNISESKCAFVQPENDTDDHGDVLDLSTVSSIPGLQASDRNGLYQPL